MFSIVTSERDPHKRKVKARDYILQELSENDESESSDDEEFQYTEQDEGMSSDQTGSSDEE